MKLSEIVKFDTYWPNLAASTYRITSPDEYYNCAAWAVHETETGFWWPYDDGTHYWPDGCKKDNSLESMVEGFSTLGFELCDDSSVENDYVKLAIYADQFGQPKHVARQLPTGWWASKMGDSEDIEHELLEDVGGGWYGDPKIYLKRSLPFP